MTQRVSKQLFYGVAALVLLAVLIGIVAPAAFAQARAALIRDSDNPALQPFQTTVTIPGCGAVCDGSFPVPAGKRLVIQSVSTTISGTAPVSAMASMSVTTNGVAAAIPIRFSSIFGYSGVSDGHATGPYYADPSSTVGLHFDYNQNAPSQTVFVLVTGYLVNIP